MYNIVNWYIPEGLMGKEFSTNWSNEEFDYLFNVANEQISKYATLNKYFTKEWLTGSFNTRFDKGIPPMISFLTHPRLEPTLAVMDQVFSAFDNSDKEFMDKVHRIRQYLPYQTMSNYFNSTLLELYLHCYLLSQGIDCSFRQGAGADIEVRSNQGIIDIEVTTRYNNLLDEEFRDLLIRCLPRITQNYRVKVRGRFESSKSLYLGMTDLQKYAADEITLKDKKNIIELGLKKEVTIQIDRVPDGCGGIVNVDMPHFIGAEMVHKQVGYKLRDKAGNSNQTGTGRPVIVVVGASNIDDSAALAIMNDYKLGGQYSSSDIPSKIDAVSMYWHTLDAIKPARVLGTLNKPASSAIVDTNILKTLGIK